MSWIHYTVCCACVLLLAHRAIAQPFSIIDHGAKKESVEIQTTAIQQTIDACASAGGGVVVVPAGIFNTGAIRLRSHVTLELEPGAVLKGSGSLDDYKIDGKLGGLISAIDAEDIAIRGSGMIDGNGMAFMDREALHVGNDFDRKFIRQGDSYFREKDAAADGPILPKSRPGNLVVFANCKKVRVSDVTLHEPPYWTLHINGSNDVVIHGITISNRQDIPNNDGIHCSTSSDVHIADCTIVTGDDAIAISGVNDHAGAVPGFIGYDKPAENVTITNCTLRSRSAGVRLGYGFNDVRNIVGNNLVIDANRGIGIFTHNHGNISNVIFTNVIIKTKLYRGHWWGKAEPIHISAISMTKEKTAGKVSDVHFRDIIADADDGILIYGEPGLIQDVSIEDLKLKMNAGPQQKNYGGNFDLRPALDPALRLFKHDIAAVFAHGADNLQVRDVQISWGDQPAEFFSHAIECEDFNDLTIEGLRGRAARSGDAIVSLRAGRGAIIRNSESSSENFLSHDAVDDLKILAGDR